MPTLFDSNILIDSLNGIDPAIAELRFESERYISIVTSIEVLAGAPTRQTESLARQLLTSMVVLALTDEVAETAANLRRTTRLKLPDAIILATARVHGLTLSTRNTKDFSRDDPAVRIPYEL